MPSVLALTSSPLTDRILVHAGVLEALARHCSVDVWATSGGNARFKSMWSSLPVRCEPFPAVDPWPEVPVNVLRRLNDLCWDFGMRNPSRLSMLRHFRMAESALVRALCPPARLLGRLNLNGWLEDRLESLLCTYNRSEEARQRLMRNPPDLVLSTGTFRFEEPAVVALAKRLGIPVLAFITSWDNVSIKNRMVFRYDGYLVWSERMKAELHAYYPHSRDVPVRIIGAPQFDLCLNPRYYLTREEFCRSAGLRPDLPVIVHALGVANGVHEHYGALALARRISAGELGEAQLIVRPHPFFNSLELAEMFRQFAGRVVVQQHGDPKEPRNQRSQDEGETVEWINTFRHADVVVHLGSTVAIDAAIFDRPVVGMDYDPQPGQPKQAVVRAVNHEWVHYKPVAESGGMWLATNEQELVEAIRTYLRHPELHRSERRWMTKYVCGYTDGASSERMVNAIFEFMSTARARRGDACSAAWNEDDGRYSQHAQLRP
jgi:hypothetical protein